MRILIIEDEPFAAKKLEEMIKEYDHDFEILEVLDSIEDAVTWFEQHAQPNLIFLDIHLADGLSFEIFDHVNIEVPIIFTTAFDRYAIQAFKTKSIDYLLKPVRFEELKLALDKYLSWFGDPYQQDQLQMLAKTLKQGHQSYKRRFLVRAGNVIKTVPLTDIAYFSSMDRTTQIVTSNGRQYPIRQNLDELESLLDPMQFYRANRQFIIRIEAIAKIQPWFKGRLKLQLSPPQGVDLVVSSEKTPAFKRWLDR